jgi:hypothetical protein
MYDEGFQIPKELDRFAIGDRDPLILRWRARSPWPSCGSAPPAGSRSVARITSAASRRPLSHNSVSLRQKRRWRLTNG